MLRIVPFLFFLALPAFGQQLSLPPLGERPTAPGAEAQIAVDLELLLLVDVSRSMTEEEHAIQRRGYAAALTSDAVAGAIGRGLLGQVAIAYVEWAGVGAEKIVVDWTLVQSPADAEALAATLLAQPAYSYRFTSISSALRFGIRLFEDNGYEGLRHVIDISGDGPNNRGGLVTRARDEALARGVTINGLPIIAYSDAFDRWGIPDLDAYYEACVIGGPGAFVVTVETWQDLAAAIERKRVLEIAGSPPRGPIPVQAYDCEIGEKIWDAMQQPFGGPGTP